MMKAFLSRILLAIVLSATALPLVPLPAQAGSATLYLSPGRKTVSPGSTIAVGVRVTASEPVNAVQADLGYNPALLDFVSISESGTSFPIAAQGTGGGGRVNIARGAITPVSGDRLVVTVYFRARTAGTAIVSFLGSSSVVRASDNADILAGSAGGTYTIARASAPAPTKRTGGGAPAPAPGAPATSEPGAPAPAPGYVPPPPPDRSGPAIKRVRKVNPTYDAVTVTWETDEPSTSVVEFGLTTNYGFVAEAPGRVTQHSVTLPSGILLPQGRYHFRIKTTDSNGNQSTSQDFIFSTLGYPAVIKAIDKDGTPIEGALVTIGNIQARTDAKGRALIRNLSPGAHLVTIEMRGARTASYITIRPEPPVKGQLQSFPVTITVPAADLRLWGLLWLLVGLIGLAFRRWFSAHIGQFRFAFTPAGLHQMKTRVAERASRHLGTVSHDQTGRPLPHHHTSFAALFFITMLAGVVLTAFSLGAKADGGAVGVRAVVSGPAPQMPAVIETPRPGQSFTNVPVPVSGSCQAGLIVKVMRGADMIGATRCTTAGRFSLMVDLQPGENRLVARTVDYNAQTGPDSGPVLVLYRPQQSAGTLASVLPIGAEGAPVTIDAPQVTIRSNVTHQSVTRGEETDWTVQVAGGRAPYAISWDWGDGRSDIASLADTGGYYARHIFTKPGTYPVIIKVSDADGRTAFLQLFAIVDDASTGAAAGLSSGDPWLNLPPWMLVAWPLYVLIVMMLLSFWLGERYEKRVLEG